MNTDLVSTAPDPNEPESGTEHYEQLEPEVMQAVVSNIERRLRELERKFGQVVQHLADTDNHRPLQVTIQNNNNNEVRDNG